MDRQSLLVAIALAGVCSASGCAGSSTRLTDRSNGTTPRAVEPPIVRRIDAGPATAAQAKRNPDNDATTAKSSRERPVHRVVHSTAPRAAAVDPASGPSPHVPSRSVEDSQPTREMSKRSFEADAVFSRGIHSTLGRSDFDEAAAGLRLMSLEQATDESPAADGTVWTLADLEAQALECNPSIRQASAVAQKGIGTRQQVGLSPNPTIGYSGQEIGDDGTYGQQGVMIEQVLVRGNKLALNRNVADQEVQRLLWQVQTQRQRVLTDVRRQFYATLGAQQRMALTHDLEQLASEAADKFRLLFENEQGTRADQLQAEVLLSEITILRRQARNERDASWRQLASLVGSPDLLPVTLDGQLESTEPLRDWQQSIQQVLSGSPQLQQAYAEAQRAQAALRRAEVQKIPNVEIQAMLMQMAASDNVGANLQIGLPIPIFNRNQGNIHRAWSELHRAQNNAQRLKLSTQAQLAAAFGDYRDAAIRTSILRDEILPRQQESVSLIERGYGTQFDFLRLFSARRAYYDARVQYLAALVDLRQSEVLIDGLMLSGGLDDIDDAAIDDNLRDAALDGR